MGQPKDDMRRVSCNQFRQRSIIIRRKSARSKLKDDQTGDNQLDTEKFDKRPQLGQHKSRGKDEKTGNAC